MSHRFRPALFVLAALGFAPWLTAADTKKKPEPGPLSEPRQRLLKGNYEEARAGFEAAAKADPKLAPAAAVGVSRSYRDAGETDQALAALTAALKSAADHPDLLAARADLLYDAGRWDEADKDADAAI